ncbi:MAG: aminopeptidase P family protein [Hyphomicrobiales bacterium]|nr:aminopeptidase P family protein [Hyphomicrobiales bacterium]
MPVTTLKAPGLAVPESRLRSFVESGAVGLSLDEIVSLVRGIAAAPESRSGKDWLKLIENACTGKEAELSDCLAHLIAQERSAVPLREPSLERVGRLRRWLRHEGLDGFVVPRCDEHQGEFVARYAERLHWLTRFSGSAGTAIVLSDQAAIFVDGRYTVQAAAEVDSTVFQICHSKDEALDNWIVEHLGPNGRLGYDPWLHTPAQVETLEAVCARCEAQTVAVRTNPIDDLWIDRPSPPLAPIIVLEERFAGVNSDEKRQRLVETMKRDRLDAFVMCAPDSIAWLLNIRGGDIPFTPVVLSFAIVHVDERIELFIDPRKVTPSVRAHLGGNVFVSTHSELGSALDCLGQKARAVGLSKSGAPKWIDTRLKEAGAHVVYRQDPCVLTKAIKNATEQKGIRAAHVRDGVALVKFLAWLEHAAAADGVTEIEAAEHLERQRAENAFYQGPSFATISAAGSNGAIIHYRATSATNRRLEPGALYLVDSGGQYLDGTTDVTRTVVIGTAFEEERHRFTLVLKGHIAIALARFPKGTTGSQLDCLARVPLWREGLDFDHGTGHGVGCFLSVHEGPQRIAKLADRVAIRPGMIVSNEPGYYKQGAYGIRIENLVLAHPLYISDLAEQEMYAFETLTLAPLDRALVDLDLLTDEEIAWVDSYHSRVFTTLGPLIEDTATRTWLQRATRPLRG